MKITIYDVAKEAGVSIATVSKVINGKGKISQARRAEIMRVIERLKYQPSVIAAALTNKKTFTLGLLIPDISNPFFGEIARAVEDQGQRHGYSVVICSTDNQDERAQRYISLLYQKSVDGLIIGTGIEDKDILRRLADKSFPVALIAREMPALSVPTVLVDDFIGGFLAATHLLKLGHSRFGVLAENMKVPSSRERVRGFKRAVEDAGLVIFEDCIQACEYRMDDGRGKALGLLSLKHPPTALFCCSDLLAVGALQAAAQLKIHVPDQVSVISFDNTVLASVMSPALTAVSQPIEHMGKLAVDLLVKELNKELPVKQRIVLSPEIVIRESTGHPPAMRRTI